MRVLLATWAATIDPGSGAARSMRTILRWLRDDGHDVKSICATPFEGLVDGDFRAEANRQGIEVPNHPTAEFRWDGIEGIVVESHTPRGQTPLPDDVERYLSAFAELLTTFRPDVLLVMGAHRALHESMRRARERGTRVVYTLRNYGYERPGLFQYADAVLTCSQYLSDYYRARIGLRSTAIPSPVEWAEVEAGHRSPRYLTFVNPALRKGVSIAARVFAELDLPTRVYCSEAGEDALRAVLDPIPEHVELAPTINDPREIYRDARVLLAPSLAEPFGRVAVEAMINGVPVVASDRGGLPEALSGAGSLVPLPRGLGADPFRRLEPPEVAPWIAAVKQAWVEPEWRRLSEAARERAQAVYAEPVQRQRYRAFFEGWGPAAGGGRTG